MANSQNKEKALEGLRTSIANQIISKLQEEKDRLAKDFFIPGKINSFVVDNLLDEELALRIYKAFPDKSEMKQKRSLREYKNIAAQMDNYDPILEEAVYAFQDNRIVKIIEEITGFHELVPDELLYAGGISLMSEGNFLNPHLDNSHNNNRSLYRVLNLLYYVTPHWKEPYGGNLELWDNGPKQMPRTVFSKFNRLVVMITNRSSVHSVSKVVAEGSRCCVSNYYFSSLPAEKENYFHVTSFYGRPEETIKNLFLETDAAIRNMIRRVFRKGLKKTKHIYKK
jgi:Rps23 Pro-64 3,4-dihydroxylase Tpa1-like proline 4-hydroxylase